MTPIYPDQAKQAGVEGVVLVQLTVTSLGGVADLEVVRGPVILRQSALDAVKQFEFEPGTKDGKAMPVRAVVEMSFKLPKSAGASGS